MTDTKISNRFAHLSPQNLGDGIATGFSSINYRGKIWSLRHGGKTYYFKRTDDNTPLSYLDVVIVGVNQATSRVYFPPGEWEETSASGPLCGSVMGITPDPGVPVPQAQSCAICSHSQWTTKPGGGKGKECQEHKRLAVLLRPEMTAKMLGSPIDTPIYLKVPPGSLRSLKAYGDSLAHRGLPFPAVITRIAFLQDRLFEMSFEDIRGLTDEEADPVLEVLDATQTKYILYNTATPQLAAPPRQAALPHTVHHADPTLQVRPVSAATYPTATEVATPAKRTRKAKAVAAPAEQPPEEAETVQGNGGDWTESDSDIDAKVNDLLSGKIQDMMK